MPIDIRRAQTRLKAAGFDPNGIDGIAGRGFYAALLAHNAKRPVDDTLRTIGGVMAAQLPLYGWDATPERLAEWVGETSNETGEYTVFAENMNYSAKRLTEVWPSRFPTIAAAQPYANNPRALANNVYGGRMGNRPETDDGYDNRGGGLLQHTGAAEYARLLQRLGFDPDDVRHPGKSVIAACDFFARAGTQALVDRGDFRGARKSVNGGYIGVDEVAARRNRALRVLA